MRPETLRFRQTLDDADAAGPLEEQGSSPELPRMASLATGGEGAHEMWLVLTDLQCELNYTLCFSDTMKKECKRAQ